MTRRRRPTGPSMFLTAFISVQSMLAGQHAWVRTAKFGSKYRDEIETAVGLALQCGEAMRSAAQSQRSKTLKDGQEGIDPVTATDLENEAIVSRGLRERFPTHAIIGEETASSAGCIPAVDLATPTWVVDPIDGTQNFCKGLPLSAVSIGLCIDGLPTVGCVYDPYRDELFLGVAGVAAYCNGEPIHADATCTTLSDALVCTDLGYERSQAGVARIASVHAALLDANTFGLRNYGSTVLSAVWVASGRANAFYSGLASRDCPKPWDWCAAAAIGAASGVCFRRFDGADGEEAFEFTAPSGLCCAG